LGRLGSCSCRLRMGCGRSSGSGRRSRRCSPRHPPVLFDYTFTIYGATSLDLAGEYRSPSASPWPALPRLFACAVRRQVPRWTAVVLAACVLSHIVPAMYALGGAVILTVIELLPAGGTLRTPTSAVVAQGWRPSRSRPGPAPCGGPVRRWGSDSSSAVGAGALRPGAFLLDVHGLPESEQLLVLFFPEADAWAWCCGGRGARRRADEEQVRDHGHHAGHDRRAGTGVRPQGSLYNVRLLPLWFMSVYLMAAWGSGRAASPWHGRGDDSACGAGGRPRPRPTGRGPPPTALEGRRTRRRWRASWRPKPRRVHPRRAPSPRWAGGGGRRGGRTPRGDVAVVPPFIFPASSLPVTVGANAVTNWSSYNYEGTRPSLLPEYEPSSRRWRASRSGTAADARCGSTATARKIRHPEALMLLPYWTNGCVDSMEDCSSSLGDDAVPLHQSGRALPDAVRARVGLPMAPQCQPGRQTPAAPRVKYFMAETQLSNRSERRSGLTLVAKSPWTTTTAGRDDHDVGHLHVSDSSSSRRCGTIPSCCPGSSPHRELDGTPGNRPSLNWYDDPSKWNVELARVDRLMAARRRPTSHPRSNANR